MRILMIEDNDDDVLLIEEMLRDEDGDIAYEMEYADRLAEGVTRLSAGGIDVVLLDLRLPDSNGFDTFKGLYMREPHVPIIVLTGLDNEALGLQAVQAGAQDYLTKWRMDGHQLQRAIRYAIERKRSEEALREQRDWLDVTLSSIDDAVIATDVKGTVTFLNPAAERITGWRLQDAFGRALDEIFQPLYEQTRQPVGSLVQAVLFEQSSVRLPARTVMKTRTENEIAIIGSAAPIQSPTQREVQGVVAVFRDISDYRRLEHELMQARKIESVGLLAGGLAHDFNNLLTGIMGNVSLAKARLLAGSSEHIVKYLTQAEQACQRATALTQQLLTFAKGGEPIRRTVTVTHLLHEWVRFALSGSNVRAVFDIDPDLFSVDIDVDQMNQAIHNVIRNAIEASSDGGTIQVQAKNIMIDPHQDLPLPEGYYIRISIRDHGFGIPQQILPNISDPYFTTKQGSSGLGLTTSYAIVAKHDGLMSVESEEGVETTVFIYLPASQHAFQPDQDELGELLSGSGRILVMDDEDYIRSLLDALLTSLGYEVDTVPSGAKAIDLYRRAAALGQPYAAVILDMTVPGGMGGLTTFERLRVIDPRVKAIISSGYSDDPVMANFEHYGFSAIIAKPYSIQKVSRVLQRVLKSK
jgi:two-component system cell cycle sensor histidine kinase/response regulator CckA